MKELAEGMFILCLYHNLTSAEIFDSELNMKVVFRREDRKSPLGIVPRGLKGRGLKVTKVPLGSRETGHCNHRPRLEAHSIPIGRT